MQIFINFGMKHDISLCGSISREIIIILSKYSKCTICSSVLFRAFTTLEHPILKTTPLYSDRLGHFQTYITLNRLE